MADDLPSNFYQFERAFPMLATACKIVAFDADTSSDDLWEACISTALDKRFHEAEAELAIASAADFYAVTNADPGELLEVAPCACAVLTGIFA